MNKQYQQVLEFTKAFGQPVPLTPTKPPQDLQGLRGKLSIEESVEIRDAGDLMEYLDGCTDLLYVALGNFIAAGFSMGDVQAAMDEVHRSNMSKLWTRDDIENVRVSMEAETGVEFGCSFNDTFDVKIAPGYEDGSGKMFIVSRKDGKIVKPPSFSPPNLSRLLP